MSESVDTRIVEAKFDSEQFEKGVDKTVKKLDELKQSLNLKDGTKSVTEFAEKTSESLDRLQKSFTTFTGMLKQKLLSGIADEIVGVFFKIKSGFEGLVSSLSSVQISRGMQRYNDILTSVRTLVSAGESQDAAYETIERLGLYADQTSYSLDSLVSTMSKFKTSGASLKTSQRMVEGLSNAAASMGVNAQQAERAYLNMQQAFSKGAMLQNDWISFESIPMVGTKFNQKILDAAVEVGTLKKAKDGTYQTVKKKGSQVKTKGADAKGITAENMGTKLSSRWFNKEVMEKVFGEMYYFSEVDIDEVNKIKEVDKKYKQKLKDGTITQKEYEAEMDAYFKTLTDKKISEKQEEMTTRQEELNAQFKAGTITETEYKKETAALGKEFEEFKKSIHMDFLSWEAFSAGQEARSLIDVLNTLKDTISRGWATSFEYIFGKLEDAKDFFTELTESELANAIYSIGEFRNAILETWSLKGGRNDLIEAIRNIDGLIGDILVKLGWFKGENAFDQEEYDKLMEEDPTGYAATEYKRSHPESGWERFTEDLGLHLKMLTRDVKNFFADVRDWFNEDLGKGETRISRIAKILDMVGVALSAISKSLSLVSTFIIRTVDKLEPVTTAIWNNLLKIVQPLMNLINPKDANNGAQLYENIEHVFNNILELTTPLINVLPDIIDVIGDVVAFFVDMGTSTVQMNVQFFADTLGLLIELLGGQSNQQKMHDGHGVLESIKDDIISIGDACKGAITAIKDFFSSIISDLRELIGLDGGVTYTNGGFFSHITNFFKNNEFINNVKKWVNQAISDVGTFIQDIPNRISKFGVDAGDFFKKIFYRKTTGSNGQPVWIKTQFTIFLENLGNTIWNFITVDIPKFVLGFPNLVYEIIHSLFYKKETKTTSILKETTEVATPLKLWLDQAVIDVKTWFASIPEKIKGVFPEGKNIFTSIYEGLFYKEETKYNGSMLETKMVKNGLATFLENAAKTIWNFITVDIPKFVLGFPNLVYTFIHGLFYKEETKYNGSMLETREIKTPLKKWLDQAVTDVKAWFISIPGKITGATSGKSIFTRIYESLFYEKNEKGEVKIDKKTGKPIENAFKLWLNTTITNIKNWIIQLPKKVAKLPSIIGELLKSIFYKKTNDVNGQRYWEKNGFTKFLEDFGKQIGEAVKNFVLNIPKYVNSAISGIGSFLRAIISALFGKQNGEEPTGQDVVNELAKPFQNVRLDTIVFSIKEIGKNIKNQISSLFTGTTDNATNNNWLATSVANGISWIKEKAEEAWKKVKEWFLSIPDWISNLFNPKKTSSGGGGGGAPSTGVDAIKKSISDFGESIGTAISELPDSLLSFWKKAEAGIGKLWKKVTDYILGTGDDAFDESYYNDLISGGAFEDAAEYKNRFFENTAVGKNITKFFEHFKEYIEGKIRNFPKDFLGTLNVGVSALNTVFQKITEWISGAISGDNAEKEIDPELVSAFETLKTTVGGFFKDTIPAFFTNAFELAKITTKQVVSLFDAGSIDWNQVSTAAYGVIDRVTGFITNIPNIVDSAIAGINELFGGKKENERFSKSTFWDKWIKDGEDAANEYKAGVLFGNVANTFQNGINAAFGTPIERIIKHLGESLKNAFTTIGPYIVEGINNALEWVQKQLGKATEWFSKATEEGTSVSDIIAGKVDTEEKNANPLWESVKRIGQTLWDIITKTLPGFIQSAAVYIGNQLPDLLGGIFTTGNQKIKEQGAGDTQTLLDALVNPKKIEKQNNGGFITAWLSKSFFDFDKYNEILNRDGTKAAEAYRRSCYKTVQEIDKESKNIDGAPSIIETITSSENKEGVFNVKTYQKLFNDDGKEAAEAYKKSCLDTMKNIDSTKKDIAASKQMKESSGYDDIFAALLPGTNVLKAGDIANSESTKDIFQTIRDTILQPFEKILDVASGFTDTNYGKIFLLLIGITLVLSQVNKIVSVSDELEQVGYAAKWTGIKVAIEGILGIIAYLLLLATTGSDDQLKAAYDMFEKAKSFITEILNLIIALSTIKFAKSTVNGVFNTIEKTGGSLDAIKGSATGVVNSFFGALKGMMISGGVVASGSILTTGFEDWLENLSTSFLHLSTGVDDLFKAVETLAGMYDKLDIAIQSIGKVKDLIAAIRKIFFIEELAEIRDLREDADDHWSADEIKESGKTAIFTVKDITGDIYSILTAFSQLSGALSVFKESVTIREGEDVTKVIDSLDRVLNLKDKMTEFVTGFVNADDGKIFDDFKTSLMSLGAALQLLQFSDMKNVEEFGDPKIVNKAVSVLQQLFSDNKLEELIKSTTISSETSEIINSNAEKMVIFAAALVSVAEACKGLTGMESSNINSLLNVIEGIDLPKDENELSEFAIRFGELGNALSSFGFNTMSLNETSISNAERAIKMLVNLAVGLKDIPNDNIFVKWFGGDKTVGKFAENIGALGPKLKDFFDAVSNNGIDYKRNNIELAAFIMDNIVHSLSRLSKYSTTNTLKDILGDLSGVGINLMTFFSEINAWNLPDSSFNGDFSFINTVLDSFDKLASVFSNLRAALPYIEQGETFIQSNLAVRLDYMAKALLGENMDGSDGIISVVNKIFSGILTILDHDDHTIQSDVFTSIVNTYTSLVDSIIFLLGKLGTIEGKTSTLNPYELLIPSFQTINDNYDVINTFLDNVGKFEQSKLQKAMDFFYGLHNLASALHLFAQKDKNGEYEALNGLTALNSFGWETLHAIADQINAVFNEDEKVLLPKITPVLDLNQEFMDKAAEMRSMLGAPTMDASDLVSATAEANELTLRLAQEQLEAISPKDYTTYFEQLITNTGNIVTNTGTFTSNLEKIKFTVDGVKFVNYIGPAMDKWLGQNGIFVVRGNYNNR